MANRIQQIISATTGAAISELKFSDLSLEAKTYIVYRSAQNTHSMIQFREGLIERGEVRAENMNEQKLAIQRSRNALQSQLHFLQSVAHYVESDEVYVEYDEASFDSEQGVLQNDDKADQLTAVARHPHAWARANLVTQGIWEVTEEGTPFHINYAGDLVIEDLARVTDRAAGQFIGQMVLSLYKVDEYIPARTAGRDLEIIALSPRIKALTGIKSRASLERALFELGKSATPFYEEGMTARQRIQMFTDQWKEISARDEDDAATKEIEDSVKEIKQGVRDVIKNVKLQVAIDLGMKELERIGASPEVIEAAKKQLSEALSK